MKNEIVEIKKENALSVFLKGDGLEDIITQVEMEISTFEHDLSTGVGRKKTASLAAKVSKTKTYLDGIGKDLVSELKKQPKIIDEHRKSMRDRLDELRDLARKPLTDWEDEQAAIEEEKRIKAEQEEIAKQIESDHEIAILMNEKFDRDLAEKLEEERKKAEEIEMQKEQERIKREEEIRKQAIAQAEIEKQAAIERAEKSEKDRLYQIEQAKIQAELADKRIAEQEQRSAIEKEQALEKARLEEIKNREAEELRKKQEQEKLEASRAHVGKIRKQSKESLMSIGINEETAKVIVLAISKGEIANISIKY